MNFNISMAAFDVRLRLVWLYMERTVNVVKNAGERD